MPDSPSPAGPPAARSPRPKSHFELFGLPQRFAIDAAELRERLRRFQAVVHPDRHAAGSDAERRMALHLAASGNEAFRVLDDAARRAAYLCELHGVPIDAERNTAMPAEFLMRQMQWREAIEDLGERPATADADALAARLEAERSAVVADIGVLLDERHDPAAAADRVRELMFHDRLLDEVRQVRRRAAARPPG